MSWTCRVLILCGLNLLGFTIHAVEFDADALALIRDEGLVRSQVMQIAG